MFRTQEAIDMALLAEEKHVSVDLVSYMCQICVEKLDKSWSETLKLVGRML